MKSGCARTAEADIGHALGRINLADHFPVRCVDGHPSFLSPRPRRPEIAVRSQRIPSAANGRSSEDPGVGQLDSVGRHIIDANLARAGPASTM